MESVQIPGNQQYDRDALCDVVAKLSTVSDFMEMLDEDFSMRKQTPEGLHLIISDCIETLNQIKSL